MAANANDSRTYNVTATAFYEILKDVQFSSELRIELKSENFMTGGRWYRFHHGTTMSSWGEKITITINEISPACTRVDIRSECGMPTQVFDWGKNKQNIAAILAYFDRYLLAPQFSATNLSFAQSQMQPQEQAFTQPQMQYSPCVESDVCFCVACGTKISKTDRFCYRCGHPVQ